ncbi:MAG: NAD(P)/FAD-dependent oxidoreductase [Opitutales bacterium]|nr:NAD(P)/FAD-dependent oxidoreductase [Opitutales bacterium]
MNQNRPHVVILGGGFAGLAAAKSLKAAPVKITLVDRQNHHLFQPLLYQVATAGLAAPDIAQPLRHIFSRQANLTTIMDEAVRLDLPRNQVELARGRMLEYDYLIIGLGVRTGYFGNDQWKPYTLGLKSLDEATYLKRRILQTFERAETVRDTAKWSKLLSFVIVGGGPTGVETAGALAELSKRIMAHDFRRINPALTHIHLVEAGPRLLPMFSESQSEYVRAQLTRMGVTVHLSAPVSEVGDAYVVAGDLRIESENIVWAAGVEGHPLVRNIPGIELNRAGRVLVQDDLSLSAYPNTFVAGDLAFVQREGASPVPCVAPAATQMGRHAGLQIIRKIAEKETKAFSYFDKGSMATIGRSSAVTAAAGIRTRGFLAWLMWLVIHLLFLMGFRNKIGVFITWVWSYLTWNRGARIITGLNYESADAASDSVLSAAQSITDQ